MKKHFGIFVLVLLASVFSCKKDEVSPCVDCGKKTGEINDRLGFVFYDSTASHYFIDFFFPGSVDIHTVNYVCDLPEKFRKTPTQVVVSGTIFETSIRPSGTVYAQAKASCLKIISIERP